jgi:integrase/recombinase XerD
MAADRQSNLFPVFSQLHEPRPVTEANKILADAFDRYLVSRGMSEPTRRAYRDTIGRLIDALGSRSLLDAQRTDIRDLQASFLDKGLASNSIRLHTCALRAFYRFIHVSGLFDGRDPTAGIGARKQPGRLPRVLTVEEIERVIAAPKNPLKRALIEVLYATGMRVSEVVKVRLADVDFDGRVMFVRQGKGRKDRIVLFGRKARAALAEYVWQRKEGFLFEHRGIPYSKTYVRLVLRELGRQARVAGLHPHALRRACATHMLEGGADLRAVQELLGHDSLSTTQLYTNLSDANLKRVHDRCHPHAMGDKP